MRARLKRKLDRFPVLRSIQQEIGIERISNVVHLIELDLLLAGPRLPMAGPLPPGDCYAFVARAGLRPNCDVYAWSIRRGLPLIPIPLRRPDPDLMLDLAAVYATAHERGRYGRRLDYAKPLGLPLADADRSWVEQRLRPARGEEPR